MWVLGCLQELLSRFGTKAECLVNLSLPAKALAIESRWLLGETKTSIVGSERGRAEFTFCLPQVGRVTDCQAITALDSCMSGRYKAASRSRGIPLCGAPSASMLSSLLTRRY